MASNFSEKQNKSFSIAAAVEYVSSLSGPAKATALEYIRRAPVEIDTPVRQLILAQFPNHNNGGGQ
ncbi:MAG: hypothetical protein ACOYM3_26355 [Terrimicrobiaceae bacterium]